jgi:hypothetical protein
MQLVELLSDEEMSKLWKLAQLEDLQGVLQMEGAAMDDNNNGLWNFLAS